MLKPLTGVLPICVLRCTGEQTSEMGIPDRMSLCQTVFLFSLLLFFSFFHLIVYCFLFVLHVQFCKAKSRCALSQLLRQQYSLTVSFALTYNLIILPSPYSSPHSAILCFPCPTHSFPVVVPIISIIISLLRCVRHSHNSIFN